MLTLVRVAPAAANSAAPEGRIRLSFEKRCVSRQRVRMEDGTEAGLILPRGTRLKDGDLLVSEDGRVVQVRASLEELSAALCPDQLTMARVAYHLGNRHASIMLGEGSVKYPADSVLDQMVTGMGLAVRRVMEPFQPESGAYDFTPVDAQISLLSTPPSILRPGRSEVRAEVGLECLSSSGKEPAASQTLNSGHLCPASLERVVAPEHA